jgi:hypothetical protein
MCLGFVVVVHHDVGGGHPYYTVNLEGLGVKQKSGERLFQVSPNSFQGPNRPSTLHPAPCTLHPAPPAHCP